MINTIAYSQVQTILFRQGDGILIDTYKGNAAALLSIGDLVRDNRAELMSGNGYFEIVSKVDSEQLPNNFILNSAALQASVVKTYLVSQYGLSSIGNFDFRYEGSKESNIVTVRYVKGVMPKSAQRTIYYTENLTDVALIDEVMSRYGNRIPSGNGLKVTKSVDKPQDDIAIIATTAEPIINFRHGSETIYRAYKENSAALELILNNVKQNLIDIQSGKKLINLTSVIPQEHKSNPAAINLASMRGAVLRRWIINNIPELTEDNFNFRISALGSDESVIVECVSRNDSSKNSEIYFTHDKQNSAKIESMLSRYKVSPLIADTLRYGEYDFDFVNPNLDPTQITITTAGKDDKIHITIYFRWDKDNIDPTYLTNARTLNTIDSIMRLKSADYIDTLRITAFASPEGPPVYNQKLSERRAESFKQYLLKSYPRFANSSVLAQGFGENWQGFRSLAEADPNLPMKSEVLAIIDDPSLTLEQRQSRIVNLDGGRLYKNYIYPKYYPHLRSGASLLLVYNPMMRVDINFEPIDVTLSEPEPETIVQTVTEPETEPIAESVIIPSAYRYIRPFAVKTNLLFDAATLLNIELEVPIGKRFSLLGEWTFPFWGGLGNRGGVAPIPYSEKYTLQMLSGGLELRYWFPRGAKLDEKAQRWGDYNPLNGWFVGPYAGMGLYDFQFGGEGIQGEFFIAAGISGGFAHPIGKHFHMEYSLGVGYLQTEYRNYTPMDGHKVYQYPGRYTWLGPTKAKISLVWIPRFLINNNK